MWRIERNWNLGKGAREGFPEKVTLGQDLKEVRARATWKSVARALEAEEQRCTGPEAGAWLGLKQGSKKGWPRGGHCQAE